MRHCLVVDDSPPVRQVAGCLIGELNFVVMEAGGVDEALDCCRKIMPEVILLDADLPDDGAISFMSALRGEPAGSKPVIIVCMSEKEMQTITKAGEAGANAYLLKPFDAEDIRAKFVTAGLTS